jgi:hypothetical protein
VAGFKFKPDENIYSELDGINEFLYEYHNNQKGK